MSQGIPTRFQHQGRRVTFRTLCAACGIPYKVLWRRYRDGDRGLRLIRPVEAKYGHRGNWHETDLQGSRSSPGAASPRVIAERQLTTTVAM